MGKIRALLLITIGLNISACTTLNEPKGEAGEKSMQNYFECLENCESAWRTCLELAEENFHSCTGDDCDELLLDQKFNCNANKSICKGNCH